MHKELILIMLFGLCTCTYAVKHTQLPLVLRPTWIVSRKTLGRHDCQSTREGFHSTMHQSSNLRSLVLCSHNES